MAEARAEKWEGDFLKSLREHESFARRQTSAKEKALMRSAVAGLLVFGFDGASVTGHAKRLIRQGAGGVILFARNYKSPEQVARLCRDLKKEASPRRLLVMVDQEGGRIMRLGPPFAQIPSALTIGSTGIATLAGAAGSVVGQELRAVNVDMDLAPVADVDTNPKNPVIGDRSFGRTAELVGSMAGAFIQALQSQGVAACAKHFPGHGDTLVDSHVALPHLAHDMKRLESVEIPPFKSAAAAGVAAVMVAHLWCPALQVAPAADQPQGSLGPLEKSEQAPRPPLTCTTVHPTSMSKRTIDYLRDNVGFKGVVATDCLEMGAVTKHSSAPAGAVGAIAAGVDLALICHTETLQTQAIDALVSAVESGRLPWHRVIEANEHVIGLKKAFCTAQGNDKSWHVVGCKEHLNVVEEINQAAAESFL